VGEHRADAVLASDAWEELVAGRVAALVAAAATFEADTAGGLRVQVVNVADLTDVPDRTRPPF